MIPFRVIRSGLLLAGLLLSLGMPLLAAADSFTTGLSDEEQAAAGLNALTDAELEALDQLVAGDLIRARQLKTSALHGTLGTRHPEAKIAEAGLDRLTPGQMARLNALVDEAVYNRPQPRERPRLKDSDVLSEQGRLQVHGGMSFTYGWAGGGRSFRESAAWVSYFDPVTGLGLGFGFSNFSGDLYPGYYYDRDYRYSRDVPFYSASPLATFADTPRFAAERAEPRLRRGMGESFRTPGVADRGRGN